MALTRSLSKGAPLANSGAGGDPSLSVSRAFLGAGPRNGGVCSEDASILLQRAGLPPLELGIGAISFRDSAPMCHLLDGDHPHHDLGRAPSMGRQSAYRPVKRRATMQGMSVPFNVYEFRASANTDSEVMKRHWRNSHQRSRIQSCRNGELPARAMSLGPATLGQRIFAIWSFSCRGRDALPASSRQPCAYQ